MTKVIIRPERISDYSAIGAVHVAAFGNRAPEALIVALHRQRAVFDPALSLVAEVDNRIVGHVLFSPHRMRLLDENIPAVNLAPIAVDPLYQNQGIGSQLITEGHAIAASKGYKVAFLLGHTKYYPRFGYHTHSHGSSEVTVPIASLTGIPGEKLNTRSPLSDDVPTLRTLWLQSESNVDFSLDPGPDLLDWLSPNPAITATIYLRDDIIVGYTRIHAAKPTHPRIMLASDEDAAGILAAHIALHAKESQPITLPLHPSSTVAGAFTKSDGAIWTCKSWAAAMACSLAPSPLDDYLTQVQEGNRLPGRIIWPVAFDLEGHT